MPDDEAIRELLHEAGDRLLATKPRPIAAGEARKDDHGKEPLELVDPDVQLAVARVYGHGRKKYGEGNYLKDGGLDVNRLYGAALRHQLAWKSGHVNDRESGLPHLAHAIASLQMIMEIQAKREAGLL